MMITPHCILHRAYLELFNSPIFTPTEVLNYIDKEMNCDIAINFVVSKFLELVTWPQASALLVIPEHKIKNLENSSGWLGLLHAFCVSNKQVKYEQSLSHCRLFIAMDSL